LPKLKIGKKKVYAQSNALCSCHTLRQLEKLLDVPANSLSLLAVTPLYYRFQVPKADGSLRNIEAPSLELKRVQRKLNEYLQSVYYMMMPEISYGYIRAVRREQNMRNIVTNAQKHTGCRYMLNVDFEDFFHQIRQNHLAALLSSKPFRFQRQAALVLARFCCLEGRLPMGAPTSPVLSNLACIALDKALYAWAQKGDFVITRFVDDVTLSSKKTEIDLNHFFELSKIFQQYDFQINEDKTQYYSAVDEKTVTGLAVSDEVSIPSGYYESLEADLQRLKSVVEVDLLTGSLAKAGMIKKYKQEVMGKINFISMVEGKSDQQYHNYLDQFEMAIDPPLAIFSASWTSFNYMH